MKQTVDVAEIEELVALLVGGMGRADSTIRHEVGHEFLRRRAVLRSIAGDIDELIRQGLARAGYDWEKIFCMELDLADFSFVPFVRMRQHPVGHGGFHSGALGVGEAMIRWIYDCGSWRSVGKRALSREINSYANFKARNRRLEDRTQTAKRKVDLFFISHFDDDHVSGISELINAVTIDTVIIPYLDPVDQAAILAASAAGEGVDDQLAPYISDLPNWFLDRGVRRVIQVEQGGLDAAPGVTRAEPPAGVGAQHQRSSVLTFIDEAGGRRVLDETGVISISPGTGWIVATADGDATDWAFLPFVSKASDEARLRVEAELTTLVGLPPTDKGFSATFLEKLTVGAFRKAVKTAYKRLGLGDANTVSMSLYAGPYRNAVITSRELIFTDDGHPQRPTGWLLTGDAELGNAVRRRDWLSYYEHIKPFLGRLMLPHHGAAHNFDKEMLNLADQTELFVCANTNDPIRPHENVRNALGKHQLRVVGTEGTGIDEVGGPSALRRSIDFNVDYLK